MTNPDAAELARAIRRRAASAEQTEELPGRMHPALLASAERALVDGRWIGPVNVMVEQAVLILSARGDWSTSTDERLLELWFETLEKVTLDFGRSPATWNEDRTERFLDQCAIVFGVEDDLAAALLQQFYQLPRAERLAVMIAIRDASVFAYINEGLSDVASFKEVPSPAGSLRALIRSVFLSA